MPLTLEDLAQRQFLYRRDFLSAEDLTGGVASSGHGAVYPDQQTCSVNAWLEDVPAGWGGFPFYPDWMTPVPGDPYNLVYSPPVAWLYWAADGRLIKIDEVRFTEQTFAVPYMGQDLVVYWVCPAPAKVGLWRYFDSAYVPPSA